MEQAGLEVWDPSKRDRRGRRVVNDEERERLLDESDRSGLTQKAFTAQAGDPCAGGRCVRGRETEDTRLIRR